MYEFASDLLWEKGNRESKINFLLLLLSSPPYLHSHEEGLLLLVLTVDIG